MIFSYIAATALVVVVCRLCGVKRFNLLHIFNLEFQPRAARKPPKPPSRARAG